MKCSYDAATGRVCVRSKGIRRKSSRQVMRDEACTALQDTLSLIKSKAKLRKIKAEARKLRCSWARRS